MEKSTFTPQFAVLRARLLAMRKAAGLTQRALAAKLNREHSLIFRIERGERRLDLVEFVWYARACGVPPADTARKIVKELEALDPSKGKDKPARRR